MILIEEFKAVKRAVTSHAGSGYVANALSRVLTVRTLAVLVAVGVGVYAVYMLWPTLTTKAVMLPDAASISGSAPPAAPAAATNIAATSVLGTASSLSNERLQLFLIATQPGRNYLEGTASLGTDPRNPQTYMAGATLANGAHLVEIYADHVVLEADGKRLSLMLDRATAATANGPTIVKTPLTSAGQLQVALTSVRAPDQTRQPRSRPAFIGDVHDLNDVVRGQPVFNDGQLSGFSVLPGQQGGRFAQLGLQSGDVIAAVEGVPITKPTQWTAVSEALLAGGTVNVSIERAGQLTVMSLDGAMLQKNAAPPMPPTISLPPGAP